ncbi:MAG TPA: Nramp family divalent metal transporter [Tepidisphaeraceae bacterium]|nr:Nramp family divalent metal transporter [Tepidisphaeraceae bacterium]
MTDVSKSRSLEDVHRTVAIPQGRWWGRMFAFAGPAYMVSVGYMDPGNWATDLEGGARFGYRLIWVLLMSNLMAVLLQTLSARLGLVTGRDLAQACRDSYSPLVRWVLFILCEIAIAACDLAEVLGTAIGINLLSGMFFTNPIPLEYAILITAFDVFLLLAIQRFGIRKMEAFIIMLVSIIGACFIMEIFLSKPHPAEVAKGFIPTKLSGDMLFVAIGILGATVMPHNLYLHSALVQSRNVAQTDQGIRQACKFNFIDSAIALNCAFFVNAAILIVAAATFHTRGMHVAEIQQAHTMLEDLLGTKLAPAAFAIALICAGQSSTITGTLAGQITMEGFLNFRIRPWLRRLITRALAIIPAVIVIYLTGESGTTRLLVLSQVILSLQLPFAVVPLVKFTSSRVKMRKFASPIIVSMIAWLVASIIIYLNVQLVIEKIVKWTEAAGDYRWLVLGTTVPLCAGLGVLLVWMIFRREHEPKSAAAPVGSEVVDRVMSAAGAIDRKIRKVGVALDAKEGDAPMIAEAINHAKASGAELLLIHVVEGVGGQYHGSDADDVERRHDEEYIHALAYRLSDEMKAAGVTVRAVLGYGHIQREIVRIANEEKVDLLVVGGHGHRGLGDLLRGTTIEGLRHILEIPILAVRKQPVG